jgi:glycosyltransferase involved in cell wall biosynthesis
MLFSVIIPNYDGSRFISPLIESLYRLVDPGVDYEILIVDNGSTDNSLALFESYGTKLRNFRILNYAEKQNSYAARNYGVRNALSPYLVFTDVDCRPNTDWLTRILAHRDFLEAGGLLSGNIRLYPAGKELNLYGLYDKLFSLNQANYATEMHGATANLVWKCMAQRQTSWYREQFGKMFKVLLKWSPAATLISVTGSFETVPSFGLTPI